MPLSLPCTPYTLCYLDKQRHQSNTASTLITASTMCKIVDGSVQGHAYSCLICEHARQGSIMSGGASQCSGAFGTLHVMHCCLWHREYEDGMQELAPISVLDVVMALQRQGAIGQYKNSRYLLSLLQPVSFVTFETQVRPPDPCGSLSQNCSFNWNPQPQLRTQLPSHLSAISYETSSCVLWHGPDGQWRQTVTCRVLHTTPTSALLVSREALPTETVWGSIACRCTMVILWLMLTSRNAMQQSPASLSLCNQVIDNVFSNLR